MKFIDPATLKSREEIIDLYKFYSDMELKIVLSGEFGKSLCDVVTNVVKLYAEELEKRG